LQLERLLVSQATLSVMELLTFYSNFHEMVIGMALATVYY